MQAIETPYTIKRRADKTGKITHKNKALAGQEIFILITKNNPAEIGFTRPIHNKVETK